MYPTKEQILQNKPKFKKDTLETIKKWKKTRLNKKLDTKQLFNLINNLNKIHKGKKLKIIKGNTYKYDFIEKIIYINKNNPSIISSLHELAHHLFGPSELKACTWSIWLFKESFPKHYSKLKWKNHLLVKKN